MITTVDNPYNPFLQFDEWYAYDTSMGYNTCAYLSRIAKTSDDISDADNAVIINDAINEIIYHDILGIYQKVSKDNFDTMKATPLSQENKESFEMMGIPVDQVIDTLEER